MTDHPVPPANAADPTPDATPDADPLLTRANITFHTNDEDKDATSWINVDVVVDGNRTRVATIQGAFNRFRDHSDAGPFTLVIVSPVRRQRLKSGMVTVQLLVGETRIGTDNDTWRCNFFLDFLFADGGHLIASANGLEFDTNSLQALSFAIV